MDRLLELEGFFAYFIIEQFFFRSTKFYSLVDTQDLVATMLSKGPRLLVIELKVKSPLITTCTPLLTLLWLGFFHTIYIPDRIFNVNWEEKQT